MCIAMARKSRFLHFAVAFAPAPVEMTGSFTPFDDELFCRPCGTCSSFADATQDFRPGLTYAAPSGLEYGRFPPVVPAFVFCLYHFSRAAAPVFAVFEGWALGPMGERDSESGDQQQAR
jgi:hypothetical protein